MKDTQLTIERERYSLEREVRKANIQTRGYRARDCFRTWAAFEGAIRGQNRETHPYCFKLGEYGEPKVLGNSHRHRAARRNCMSMCMEVTNNGEGKPNLSGENIHLL
jgi:hypothetical protein